jgi:aldehyde dehydrogenase (NAD+)
MNIEKNVKNLRAFFNQKKTLSIDFRIEQLKKLQLAIRQNENKILEALKADLNKSPYEAYLTEIGTISSEIKFTLKRLKKWAKPKKVKTPITHFPGKSYIYPEPYGVTLIMSPWNYPFQLSIMPLIGAIAAGNCALIKPSNYSSHTSKVIYNLIHETFPSNYINVVLGGRDENQALLSQKFDFIFFTGSVNVGKIVMEAASKTLTPVCLELGGKSPCLVDENADLELAAKRIIWGKMLNGGQTCVAPDYVLVNEKVKDTLVQEMINVLKTFYSEASLDNIPSIINEHHFNRLTNLINQEKIIFGGKCYPDKLQIEGTLVETEWDSPIMETEIFGPILPIITYDDINEVINQINNRPKPLALYLFTNDKKNEKLIISNVSFGGGCINDTIMHLATPYLAFGGVGESGMGSYHGAKSYETFSHYKSVLRKSRHLDIALRYPPFDKKIDTLRKFM